MEQMHGPYQQPARSRRMDLGGNSSGQMTDFPAHGEPQSLSSYWLLPLSLEAHRNYMNRARAAQRLESDGTSSEKQTQIAATTTTGTTGTSTSTSGSATHTSAASACEVNKQNTAARPRQLQQTTQNILEQMLLELDRTPLITFTGMDGPARNLNPQYTSARPPDTYFLPSSATSQYSHVPMTDQRHQQANRSRDVARISAIPRVPPMLCGATMQPYGANYVVPTSKALQSSGAPQSQIRKSLMELSRLVDSPVCEPRRSHPVGQRKIQPVGRSDIHPVGPSDRSSKIVPVAVGRMVTQPITKRHTVKTTPPKKPTATAHIPSHRTPTAMGPLVGVAPCVTPNDTSSTELTTQDAYKDSRCQLTTKYGDVSVDQEVKRLMNVDESGQLLRHPVVILKRLSEHVTRSRLCQNRRMTRPTRLKAYLCDGDSDTSDDSAASAYVPPSDGSVSSCETPQKRKLESDFSDTSADNDDDCSSFDDGSVSDLPST